jgi:hypothetical protein
MSLAENTKTALDESRTLMLGAQSCELPATSAFAERVWDRALSRILGYYSQREDSPLCSKRKVPSMRIRASQ